MCSYTGADDLLRVTRHDLPADSLKRRLKTLVKIPRGQQVPELFKDIYMNDQCPPLNTLAEDNFRTIIRVPVTSDTAEEAPEDDEEEEDQAPRKAAPRPTKRPRAKAPGSEAGASGEASAKKPKTTKPPPLDSRKAERARLRMLSTAGQGTRPIIPGAPNPKTAATRTTSQEPITKYMKKSPAVGPSTPVPPSASYPTPQPSPPQADPSPPPAANTPPEIIPVSSGHVEEEDPKAKSPAQEEAETQGQGDAEVTSEKAGEGAGDIVVFPKNFGDPADTTSTPKAYATKFFNKLTEAEKWELEQDLLNAMLNNAWGKPDSRTSEIQDFKKNIGQFCDQLICKQKEQQALHYELHKNIALQRRVTLSQAENIRTLKDENAELAKQLADAQGASSSLATASTELENLRSSYQELETKLKEAELKREQAEKQLAEKNSEHIREKGELELKKNADSETIRRQQKELNGLRKFMETMSKDWDLLNENILGGVSRGARRCPRRDRSSDEFTPNAPRKSSASRQKNKATRDNYKTMDIVSYAAIQNDHFEDAIWVTGRLGLQDLMKIQCDYSPELIKQFFATLAIRKDAERTMEWTTGSTKCEATLHRWYYQGAASHLRSVAPVLSGHHCSKWW
ncbi:uncharacterized protein [Lolium perenne]|uniref:uncharacterized protein n=1 Tax=Lolium perenne TaxID=4522 RepID=UPI003A99E7E2